MKKIQLIISLTTALLLCIGCNKSDTTVNRTPIDQIVTAEPTATPISAMPTTDFINLALSEGSYSRDTLISYMTESGYDETTAINAVDNSDINWNEQAIGYSKFLLQTSSYSYSGLVDALAISGFTTEQATYGANNCNADWIAEAIEAAGIYYPNYISNRPKLIEKLQTNGFTLEQATTAADSVINK